MIFLFPRHGGKLESGYKAPVMNSIITTRNTRLRLSTNYSKIEDDSFTSVRLKSKDALAFQSFTK